MESPSLEVFKNCGDVALRAVAMGMVGGGLGLERSLGPSHPNLYDSVVLIHTAPAVHLFLGAGSSVAINWLKLPYKT